MPYTINKYNGAPITVVADGTVDQTTSLKLVGKNYAGYGEIQNENFLYLLENFASPSPGPSNPIPGQLWFDTAKNKLNFYDKNLQWRTAGGSSAQATAPTGLVTGDFWFDTGNNQLYVWNADPSPGQFVLVGPEGVPGSGITQMLSESVVDQTAQSHSIIKAVVNDQVAFIISTDATFTLDNDVNAITGFSTVQQGVTLAYTNNEAEPGQTQNNFRFWGTASNSELFGGLEPADYILSASPTFNAQVHFTNDGFTVGSPYVLEASIIGGTPNISNTVSNEIRFNTTVSSVSVTPLRLIGKTLQPGSSDISVGTISNPFNVMYANNFNGIASQSDTVKVGATYVSASTEALANTVVARTNVNTIINGVTCGPGSIKGTYFIGTATAALYADLAEKYLADQEYPCGTVVVVGGDKEITAASPRSKPIGVVSTAPAYLMNSALEGGTPIALKGRVPVLVKGPVNKGDHLIAGENGCAVTLTSAMQFADYDDSIPDTPPAVFGIALSSNDGTEITLVECVIL